MNTLAELVTANGAERSDTLDIYRGLLWKHWRGHGGAVRLFLAAWFVLGWVVLLFSHPAFILVLGSLYAMAVGFLCGGSEAVEGSEEFSFALPATRTQRYLAGLVFGGAPLLLLVVGGLMAISWDLPQRAWGLVVETGLTASFRSQYWRDPSIHWISAAVPIALFSFTYSIGASARTRGVAAFSQFIGLLLVLAIALPLLYVEHRTWIGRMGRITVPALFAAGAASLVLGGVLHARKEVIARPGRSGSSIQWWIVAAVLLALLFFFGVSSVAREIH